MVSSLDTLRRERLQLEAQRGAGSPPAAAYDEARAAPEQCIVSAVLADTSAAPVGGTPWRLVGAALACTLAIVFGGAVWIGRPTTAAAPPADPAQRPAVPPGDAAGWAALARRYVALGQAGDALEAYRKAAELQPEDPALLADYADMLAMSRGRRLSGEPLQLVQRALALDPGNLKALALAGTEAFDRQDFTQALHYWERLRALAPAGDGLLVQMRGGIDEARQRAGPQP